MILWAGPDLEARAADLIGVPFKAKGATPAGWDCKGLGRWCLLYLCGVATPDYDDLYDAALLDVGRRHERARLIADGFNAWRPVEPQAGAIAWLEWLGSAGHVGFMLSPRRLIHSDTRCGTALLDLDDPAAGYRLRGAFVPAAVTEIRNQTLPAEEAR